MDDRERRTLLGELRRGETSRNREYDRFREPDAARVLHGYRRIRSLVREARRPDARIHARWTDGPGRLAVAVERPRFRYRRILLLDPWEVEYLLDECGDLLPSTRLGGP